MEKIDSDDFLKSAYAFQLALESGFILENNGVSNWKGSKIPVPIGIFKPAYIKNAETGLPVSSVQNVNMNSLNVVYYKVNPSKCDELTDAEEEIIEIPLIDVLIYFLPGKEINDIEEINDLLKNDNPLTVYKKSIAEKVIDSSESKDVANCYLAEDVNCRYSVSGKNQDVSEFSIIPFKTEKLEDVISLLYKFNYEFEEITEGLHSSIKDVNELDKNDSELVSLIDMDYVTTLKKMIDSDLAMDENDIVAYVVGLNIYDEEKARIIKEATEYLTMRDIYNPKELEVETDLRIK